MSHSLRSRAFVFSLQAWLSLFLVFFFNDTATTEIYTLSLHDALPISSRMTGTSTWTFRSLCGSRRRRRSEEHTSELQSHSDLVCRLLLEKKKQINYPARGMQPNTSGKVGRQSGIADNV